MTFDDSLSHGAARLYSALDEYARDKAVGFPSQKTLCERMGIPRRSIVRYLAELREAGYIESARRNLRNGPNEYRLKMPDLVEPKSLVEPKVAQPVEPKVARPNASILSEQRKPSEEEIHTQRARENPPALSLVPARAASWEKDASFQPFADLARTFWGTDLITPDLANGWQFGWRKLDLGQKMQATRILQARIEAGEDPRYVKRLPRYLEHGDWQRPPRAALPIHESVADGIIRRAKQRIASGERPI